MFALGGRMPDSRNGDRRKSMNRKGEERKGKKERDQDKFKDPFNGYWVHYGFWVM